MHLLAALLTAVVAASGPALTAKSSPYGKAVFDGRGFVLYAFTRDHGRSACYGACASRWPPYYARQGKLTVGAGIKRTLLGTVKRRSGRRQVTYAGRPLYHYATAARCMIESYIGFRLRILEGLRHTL